jgi:hypothetical protein
MINPIRSENRSMSPQKIFVLEKKGKFLGRYQFILLNQNRFTAKLQSYCFLSVKQFYQWACVDFMADYSLITMLITLDNLLTFPFSNESPTKFDSKFHYKFMKNCQKFSVVFQILYRWLKKCSIKFSSLV